MLGLPIIERLLPHRTPFLMVESVLCYTGGKTPVLRAERPIRPWEPVFLGPRPCLHWPAVYIIEGLGQASLLLSLLVTLERRLAAKGLAPDRLFAGLECLGNGRRNDPAQVLAQMLDQDRADPMDRMGLSAAVDVEILGQARVGDVLHYTVEQTHGFDGFSRFNTRASIGERVVVRGTLVGARGVG